TRGPRQSIVATNVVRRQSLRLADFSYPATERELVKTRDWQRREHLYSPLKHPERVSERIRFVEFSAFDGRGVWLSPVRGHRVTGPYWTYLARGVVADREDKVDRRRTWLGELIPCLASKSFGRKVLTLQQ